MLKCNFCDRTFTNSGARGKHQKTCNENPHKIDKCGGVNRGYIPWNKGLSKESDKRLLEFGRNLSEAYSSGKISHHHTPHSDETKLKMAESKNKLYASGWECKAGRCKKYDYSSHIAGDIKVDGTWELIFCKYADAMNLTWRRNITRFPYVKPNGKSSTYQPDFYVEEWGCYVEVKGYETDIDKAKWEQFPLSLKVLRKKEISELDEWLKSAPC